MCPHNRHSNKWVVELQNTNRNYLYWSLFVGYLLSTNPYPPPFPSKENPVLVYASTLSHTAISLGEAHPAELQRWSVRAKGNLIGLEVGMCRRDVKSCLLESFWKKILYFVSRTTRKRKKNSQGKTDTEKKLEIKCTYSVPDLLNLNRLPIT